MSFVVFRWLNLLQSPTPVVSDRAARERDAYRDGGAGRVGSISRGGKRGQRPAATISPVTQQ